MAEATKSELEREMDNENASDAKAVYDWLKTFGQGGAIKLSLNRRHPTIYKGFPCGGKIATYEEPISEEEIQEEHGGGKYQIIVHRQNPKSGQRGQPSFVFGGSRTFVIAGYPKLDNLEGFEADRQSGGSNGSNGEPQSVVSHALTMANDLTRRAEERAERAETRGGTNYQEIQALMQPMRDQLSQLTQQLMEKDRQIVELMNRPPDTTSQDKIFDIYQSSSRDQSQRLEEIRMKHDSELRALREFNQNEISNREIRFEKEIDAVRESHRRELDTVKATHGQAMESMRQAYEMRIDSLRDSSKRVDRDLTEARSELVALRAKKDVGPAEQLQTLVTLKTSMDSLIPTPEPPEPSTLEKVLNVVTGSPMADKLATRAMGAIAQNGPEQAPSQKMVPFTRSNGEVVQIPEQYLEQAKEQDAQEVAENPIMGVSPDDIAKAVALLENAYRNNIEPGVVGASARNMVPAAILQTLKMHGVDHFLNNVAQLEDSSPLATAEGRMYVRLIAKFLLEGSSTTETAPDAAGDADGTVDIDEPDSPVENE